jgi:hypothetical protein
MTRFLLEDTHHKLYTIHAGDGLVRTLLMTVILRLVAQVTLLIGFSAIALCAIALWPILSGLSTVPGSTKQFTVV